MTTRKVFFLAMCAAIGSLLWASSGATYAASPGTVTPFGEGAAAGSGNRAVGGHAATAGRAVATLTSSLQDGADHIVGQQCGDGGWGWPHASCTTTYYNITGPIALGVMSAYRYVGDSAHLASAVAGGDYDLTGAFPNATPAFGSFAPGFLHILTQLTGDGSYSTFVETGFFDALTAKTYGDASVGSWAAYAPADTYAYLDRHKASRSGGWLINLRPWDMQYMPWVAGMIGNADSTTPADGISQQQTFLQAVLDGLDTLDSSLSSDLIGLAGGVHGLALNGTETFPALTATKFAAIAGDTTLCELAAVLAGLQNADGSWSWMSSLQDIAGEQDTQTTAYAVLALDAADAYCTDYSGAVSNGRNWLMSMQLVSGGFLSYPGGDENVEVEGEALSALYTGSACGNGQVDPGEECDDGNDVDYDGCSTTCVNQPASIPTVSEWGLIVMTLVGLVIGSIMFARSRRVAETG